jgi:hypothetical protein
MTKTEAEQAILALPGVANYRERKNDLQRTVGYTIEMRDGVLLSNSLTDRGANTLIEMRDQALSHLKGYLEDGTSGPGVMTRPDGSGTPPPTASAR